MLAGKHACNSIRQLPIELQSLCVSFAARRLSSEPSKRQASVASASRQTQAYTPLPTDLYTVLPVPEHISRRSPFSQSELFPSKWLRMMLKNIEHALNDGLVTEALGLYLKLRTRHAQSALKSDPSLADLLPPQKQMRWLQQILSFADSKGVEVVNVAVRWLRTLEDSPDSRERPTSEMLITLLRAYLAVYKMAEQHEAAALLKKRTAAQAGYLVSFLTKENAQVPRALLHEADFELLGDLRGVEAEDVVKLRSSWESSDTAPALSTQNSTGINMASPNLLPTENAEDSTDAAPAGGSEPIETAQQHVSDESEALEMPVEDDGMPELEVSSVPTFGIRNLRTIIGKSIQSARHRPLRERQVALEKAVEEAYALSVQDAQDKASLARYNGSRPGESLQTYLHAWQLRMEDLIKEDEDTFWESTKKAAENFRTRNLTQAPSTGLQVHLDASDVAVVAVGTLMSVLADGNGSMLGVAESKAIAVLGLYGDQRNVLAKIAKEDKQKLFTGNGAGERSRLREKLWSEKGLYQNLSQIVKDFEAAQVAQTGPERKTSQNETGGLGTVRWPKAVQKAFGQTCLEYMLRSAEDDLDVFDLPWKGRRLRVVVPRGTFHDMLQDPSAQIALGLKNSMLPMLMPPRAWKSVDDGAYLVHDVGFLRHPTPEIAEYARAAEQRGALNDVFVALDILGRTAWTVNNKLLSTVVQAWNANLNIGKLIARDTEAPAPAPLSAALDEGAAQALLTQWKRSVRTNERNNSNNYSQRVTLAYSLQVALLLRNQPFYLPYTCDFRGRVYPLPSYLSPTGSDFSRALLQFADARPLGKRGLFWLKVQLAGMCGKDKSSFDERVAWIDAAMGDIEDSADHPIDGKGWWQRQDKPWQCLANCIELVNALRSPEPESYESRIPVQTDGTCNGLQHYAALSRDPRAAQSVSLMPADKPGDVYTVVATEVSRLVEEEWQLIKDEPPIPLFPDEKKSYKMKGDELTDVTPEHAMKRESVQAAAAAMRGKVVRKVVKQSVMTTTYGVTLLGMVAQIEKQLKELHIVEDLSLRHACAFYVARKVQQSLGVVFERATKIQEWFGQCVRLICRSVPPERVDTTKLRHQDKGEAHMTSVVWTTPLGLPVVQPYRYEKEMGASLQTTLNAFLFNVNEGKQIHAIDPRAQARAFPPNYIHSLDATHMFMTAMSAHREGLIFGSVHDSFWTHACDADHLNRVLREEFVQLYNRPLLQDLRDEWLIRFGKNLVRKPQQRGQEGSDVFKNPPAEPVVVKGVDVSRRYRLLADLLPMPPEPGDFDLTRVKDSAYFFN